MPKTIIIFSEIVPRLAWSTKSTSFMDKIRKRINKRIKQFLPKINYSYRHIDIDGMQLSPIGLDIFIVGLQSWWKEVLCDWGCHDLVMVLGLVALNWVDVVFLRVFGLKYCYVVLYCLLFILVFYSAINLL